MTQLIETASTKRSPIAHGIQKRTKDLAANDTNLTAYNHYYGAESRQQNGQLLKLRSKALSASTGAGLLGISKPLEKDSCFGR